MAMQESLDIDAVHKLIGKKRRSRKRPVPKTACKSTVPSGSLLASEVISIELLNENDGQSGSYHASANRRQVYENILITERLNRIPFDHRVSIVMTRILGPGQKMWDADSVLRGSAKQLLDSLVGVGWFHDDGPKWIATADGRQDDTQRQNGPAVRVDVYSA